MLRICGLFLGVLCLFAVAYTPVAFANPDVAAQEASAMKAQVSDKEQALLNSPPGVFDVEYQDGQLLRLKIKGENEVPTSMQGVRADRNARERAERNAKAAFSKFLSEQVTVVESDTEGFLIKEKDGKESAEYLNASQKTMMSLSSSLLRGLVILFDHVEGEGAKRKAVIVLGWSKKLVAAAGQAESSMQRKPEASAAPAPAQSAPGTAPAPQTQTRTGDLDKF